MFSGRNKLLLPVCSLSTCRRFPDMTEIFANGIASHTSVFRGARFHQHPTQEGTRDKPLRTSAWEARFSSLPMKDELP